MKLLILFGPPAVGKTTVGQIVESKTDYKLFHNHMVMDGVMHIFGVGTPSEDRLSKSIRSLIITEAARANVNLIFTYVWNFDNPKGKQNIDTYKQIYEQHGGDVQFIELTASLNMRMDRAAHPDRHSQKAHAPDSQRVADLNIALNTTSVSPFYYPDHYTQIDTTDQAPAQVAAKIIELL